MKKIIVFIFLFSILAEFLSAKDRESVLFGFFFGNSYATGHYENKRFEFGGFHGYNVQFYFSKYFGLKVEWIKQDKEVFYIYLPGIYDYPVYRKYSDWSLMLDFIFKYPTRYFTPFLTVGYGGVEASIGEVPLPLPGSGVGRIGAGIKIGGKPFDFLFLNFNLGISYFTRYADGYLNTTTVQIYNNQRWSLHYGVEFGF